VERGALVRGLRIRLKLTLQCTKPNIVRRVFEAHSYAARDGSAGKSTKHKAAAQPVSITEGTKHAMRDDDNASTSRDTASTSLDTASTSLDTASTSLDTAATSRDTTSTSLDATSTSLDNTRAEWAWLLERLDPNHDDDLYAALAPLLAHCRGDAGPAGAPATREIRALRLWSARALARRSGEGRSLRRRFGRAERAGASALADATKVDAYASRPGDARAKHAGFFLGGRKTNSRNAVAGRGKRHQNGAATAQPAAGGRQAKWAAPVRKPRRNHKAKL